MIEKRLKNLLKLGTLIIARQGYFLGRNWYQMIYNPYLTLKNIKTEKDKSQFFLIIFSALFPICCYIIGRLMWDLLVHGQLLWLTGNVFWAVVFVQALILGYLAYWSLQVLIKE